MMLILIHEWRRFVRDKTNLLIAAAALLILCACGAWSGLQASAARTQAGMQQAQWEQRIDQRRKAAPLAPGADAARQAFDVGRDDPPPTPIAASGALVLGVQQAALGAPAIRVTVESRYTDGRRSDPLLNPLLRQAGALDFAVVMALLLPLTLISLCYGMVQDARERGIWALVCAQSRRPWRVLLAALAVRLGATMLVAALASMLAFSLDHGATLPAFLAWMAALGAFALVWTALCALANLVRIPAAACGLALLGVWLLTSFAAPPALQRVAQAGDSLPSRLEAVAQLRAIQQDAEVRMAPLLKEWYAAHPALAAAAPGPHAWPVSFMPRLLEQDRGMRPLMLAYTQENARRTEQVERWSWLSPALALTMTADRLAGHDPLSYARYVADINRFEDAWRGFLVPRIMGYSGIPPDDLAHLPVFAPTPAAPAHDALLRRQLLLALLLAALFTAFSGRLKRP